MNARVLRPTLVYLRDRHPGESTDIVPSELQWEAGQIIHNLPNSSRQLWQVSYYNGAWYAEPIERRSQP